MVIWHRCHLEASRVSFANLSFQGLHLPKHLSDLKDSDVQNHSTILEVGLSHQGSVHFVVILNTQSNVEGIFWGTLYMLWSSSHRKTDPNSFILDSSQKKWLKLCNSNKVTPKSIASISVRKAQGRSAPPNCTLRAVFIWHTGCHNFVTLELFVLA